MSKLELYNIYAGYEESKPVLKDISFFVEKGEFIVLLGTSGCGKTTILNLIAGMIPISAGELYIDGVKSNDTPPRKRNIAMVFQNYALYPTMTAYENIAFPLQNIKKFPFDIIKAARLDGASDVRIFFRLCIPYLKPVFISAFIITFFESWNSILIPVVIIQSSEKFTNSIYLNSIGSIWFSDYGVLMASLLISTLPTLISFLIFRHYIKRGIYYHDK
ncbi:ATP-binding cassette domain-containing protein [Ruminococcus sp. YE78]|uniref:ATP-binding cassette domain-containing protein n=1 Tax=Ruminococcus sp. YE78 TaxID=1352374 RepID=UPI0008808FE8|nr:ATP-binding cassette domain-containing protein [Ruminococcus sp. YE78]SDA32599.1 Binding-protein-dependent transport system inner membrane component [Ruminococcus sp. YE78]